MRPGSEPEWNNESFHEKINCENRVIPYILFYFRSEIENRMFCSLLIPVFLYADLENYVLIYTTAFMHQLPNSIKKILLCISDILKVKASYHHKLERQVKFGWPCW